MMWYPNLGMGGSEASGQNTALSLDLLVSYEWYCLAFQNCGGVKTFSSVHPPWVSTIHHPPAWSVLPLSLRKSTALALQP